jgi:inner membrane protein
MVLLEGIALGWLLIATGAVLLLVEVHILGFFATVPATVMIFLGISLFRRIDIFNSGWGVIGGIVIALAAAGVTVWMYGKITPNESPTTISHDSLIGKEGRVKTTVNPYTLTGKVFIASNEWITCSTDSEITPGKKVKLVDHMVSVLSENR